MNSSTGTRSPPLLSPVVNNLIAEGDHALLSDDKRISTAATWNNDIAHLATAIRARLMARYSIYCCGVYYQRDGYRYDELADAVRYARTHRSLHTRATASQQRPKPMGTLTESERALMNSLRITFSNRAYHFGTYRYERLSDAVTYAQLKSAHVE